MKVLAINETTMLTKSSFYYKILKTFKKVTLSCQCREDYLIEFSKEVLTNRIHFVSFLK